MAYYLIALKKDPKTFFIYDEHNLIASACVDTGRAGIWSKKEIFLEDFPLYLSSLTWMSPDFEKIMRGENL